ncbi:hypothetical protein GCM10020001_111970 [Nonomuraea salmonea]
MRAPAPSFKAMSGAPHRDGEIHHFVDLGGMGMAERTAEEPEVRRVHEDPAAENQAGTGDDAVRRGPLAFEAEPCCHVAPEQLDLGEGVLVQQQIDPFAGRQLAFGVLAPGGFRVSVPDRLAPAAEQLGQFPQRVRPAGRRVVEDVAVRPRRGDPRAGAVVPVARLMAVSVGRRSRSMSRDRSRVAGMCSGHPAYLSHEQHPPPGRARKQRA